MTLLKQISLVCLLTSLVACGGGIGLNTPTPGSGIEEDVDFGDGSGGDEPGTDPADPGAGDDSGDNQDANVREGVFLDGRVANLRYRTATQEGVTGSSGYFHYLDGEVITFAIGDLELPSAVAGPTLTPLDLVGTDDVNANAVVNIVRLLISLDSDGNPDNGINIDELAHGAATAFEFDQEVGAFAQSSAVVNLLNASGSSNTELVPLDQALGHFQTTLENQVNDRVVVSANGPGETYELFNNAFGGSAVESPVCDPEEDSFGRRITEVMDETLEEYVFAFHILRDIDGDRCIETITDRQRIEVKTYSASPEDRVASEGEVHSYRWKFRLDEGFQPSSSFTHIFQIKAAGGDDDGMPILTFTPRAGNPETLEVLHAPDGASGASLVTSANLAEFKGEWVEAFVRVRNQDAGNLEVEFTRLSDGESLVAWSDNDIDMWRAGANINRPKWGIYRSLNNLDALRDETVLFNDFCIAESTNVCSSDIGREATPPNDIEPPDFGFESEAIGEAPTDFDVEGSIVVSDEQAREGDQSVKFSHPVDGQVRMRQVFGPMETGALKASVRIPVGIDVDTLVTIYAASYNSANRAVDLLFKDDGFIHRRQGGEQIEIQSYTPGEWTDLEIRWQNLSVSNEFTLIINGTEAGTFPVATENLTPERVEFKFGGNSGAVTSESMYLDAVSVLDEADLGDGDSGGETEEPAAEPDFDFETDPLGQAPSGFSVEGDIQLSDAQSFTGTQSVKFSHPLDGQVRMRSEWAPANSGSFTASVYIPSGVGVDTLITLYADTYNSANRSMDILFKPDGTLRRRESSGQQDVATYDFDAWNLLTLTWTDVGTSNEFTLWINGVEQGTFPVATPDLVPARIEFKFGGNAGEISNESIYVDSIFAF